jgi:hypothetical protein
MASTSRSISLIREKRNRRMIFPLASVIIRQTSAAEGVVPSVQLYTDPNRIHSGLSISLSTNGWPAG